jgi:ATP-binding cassette subfamily B protein
VTTFGLIVRRGSRWLPLIGVTALLGTLVTLGLPYVLGRTLDALVSGGDTGRWFAVAGGLIALGVTCEIVDTFADTACIATTTAWLRTLLIRHVLAIGPDRAREFDTGDLVSRVSSNAVDAAHAGPAAVTLGAAVAPPVGSLVVLALIDLWLAVAFVAGVVLVVIVLWAFARRTADIMSAYQAIQGRIAARLSESLTGARTIGAAGTVHREERRVLEPLPALREQGQLTWRVLGRSNAQASVVGPLVLIAVLAAAGIEVAHGRITAGDLLAASQYAVIGAGLGSLTNVLTELARARSGARRAGEVLDVPVTAFGPRDLARGGGQLEFRGVTVRAGDTTLLDNVHLDLPAGAAVAVVGRSGAGKSVLTSLAARLRDPDAGEVLLDGVPLREIPHDALRAAIGCAFERPALVGHTVGDAIAMGRDGGDATRVRAAARATHAHDFLSRLPLGYDTPLADAPMSGGERQRVGLARAWQAERLLVLDDATSSLDTVTEMQISRTLTSGEPRRTRLIVTHRPATAAGADLVVWLDAGQVRAVGPHEQLCQDPAYVEAFT